MMELLIIAILSVFLIISLWKYFTWKFTALSITAYVIEKCREPTDEEMRHYGTIAIKKLLHIR